MVTARGVNLFLSLAGGFDQGKVEAALIGRE
jgi:hypothetical protein